MHIHRQIAIECPPAKLWPLLTEPERIKTWLVALVDDTPDGPQATGVGVTSTMRLKEGGKISPLIWHVSKSNARGALGKLAEVARAPD